MFLLLHIMTSLCVVISYSGAETGGSVGEGKVCILPPPSLFCFLGQSSQQRGLDRNNRWSAGKFLPLGYDHFSAEIFPTLIKERQGREERGKKNFRRKKKKGRKNTKTRKERA